MYCISYIIAAFSVVVSSSNAYCGYGTSNTAFRLALAIATVIFGVLMATPVLKERPNLTSLTLFAISILWYSATVADSTAYINAAEACNDSFGKQSGVTCNGTSYGITVTLYKTNFVIKFTNQPYTLPSN